MTPEEQAEAEKVAADLSINRMKNTGELLQREIHRAHVAEINSGEHS